jgi:hypothetical protein
MAIYGDIVNYCNFGPSGPTGPTGGGGGTGFWSVQQWVGNTSVTPGSIVRNRTPAVGSERCFIAITGGTAGSTEPAWTTTRGASNTDNTTIWLEATGLAGLNGDLANTPTWAQLKAAGTPNAGMVIQRNNGASLQICQATGSLGASEPAFSDTAGVRTVESGGTAVWISLGASSNYAKWGAPHARIANACTSSWNPFGASGGNLYTFAGHGTVYVGDTHHEYQATGLNLIVTLTPSDLFKIICVDHTVVGATGGNLMNSAQISTTADGNHITITATSGGLYTYGINFQAGLTGANNGTNDLIISGTNANHVYEKCSFIINNGATGSLLQVNPGNASSDVTFINCQLGFGNPSHYIDPGTSFWNWKGNSGPSAFQAGLVSPSTLVGDSANGRLSVILWEGLDLSNFTGQINGSQQAINFRHMTIKDCKLNTAATMVNPVTHSEFYQLIDCEIGATGTAYKSSRYAFEATESTETSIVRVGGAVDGAGNAQSRKIVTTGTSAYLRPYRMETLAIYNTKTGSAVTVTVSGTWNVASVPNNDDIWMEVEYLGTTTYPVGSFLDTSKGNVLFSNAACSSDSSTWNGGGSGAGWSPFKFSVTVTPRFAGLIQVKVRAAKPSTTFYIDPKIILT